MSDFLQRESEILGSEFASTNATGDSFATAGGDEIDFDRAASAFPDISFDGSSEIPTSNPSVTNGTGTTAVTNGFSFDDFDTPPRGNTEVKVTGDDEIEKFENEFPDIDVPQVRWSSLCLHTAYSNLASRYAALLLCCVVPAHFHVTFCTELRCCSSLRPSSAAIGLLQHPHLEPPN